MNLMKVQINNLVNAFINLNNKIKEKKFNKNNKSK